MRVEIVKMTAPANIEKKPLDLDDVLIKFPILGRYYTKTTFFVILAYMSNSWYCTNYVFANEEVKYRCKDEGLQNVSNICSSLNVTVTCTEWEYENPHSFVAEFDLACEDWKRTLVGTMTSFGYMVGLLFVGPLSDKYGRKKVAIITGVIGGVVGVTKSFVSMYWLYIFLQFFEAAAGDVCSPFFMLTIEMVASERRILYQMICNFGYCFGGLSLPLIAYLFPYWRTFLRILYTPAIFFFVYAFIIDESPRWLLSKGQKDKAINVLERVAGKDKIVLDKNVLDRLAYVEETKDIGWAELIKNTISSRALILRFFVCLSWWITSTFVNYGLTINSVSLQGNKYINYALVASMDIPGNVVTSYTMVYFKRKIPLITCFFMASVFCFSQPFVPASLPWLSIMLYMVGKLMSGAFFNITYIYTSELFPTYTRNSMHALCSSLGRIGSIIAPQTPLLMRYWESLPSLVFGSASLIAGLLTLLVPETGDHCLPDTVKQAEALGKAKEKEANETTINFVIPTRTTTNPSKTEKTRM